jgi:ADP-heptose:LPS heptosyltransferase
MHSLTLTAALDCGPLGSIPAGEYLVEDVQAAQLLIQAPRGAARIAPPPSFCGDLRVSEGQEPGSVLFSRSGGFGDLLFLSPLLAEVRRRWPRCRIGVACAPPRRCVLDGLGLVDTWEPVPVPLASCAGYERVIAFEHVVENAGKLHYVDALAKSCGLELPAGVEARRCRYTISEAEKAWVAEYYPRNPARKRLGVQWQASIAARSYPLRDLHVVCGHLGQHGWDVWLLGAPDAVRARCAPGSGVRNVAMEERPTFRQSCAILSTCDVVLAPDSALLHVAGALGIPAVGLFGPIDPRSRLAYSPSVRGLKGAMPCAGCGHHPRHPQEWPAGMPCSRSGQCDALAAIAPRIIISAVEGAYPVA